MNPQRYEPQVGSARELLWLVLQGSGRGPGGDAAALCDAVHVTDYAVQCSAAI